MILYLKAFARVHLTLVFQSNNNHYAMFDANHTIILHSVFVDRSESGGHKGIKLLARGSECSCILVLHLIGE